VGSVVRLAHAATTPPPAIATAAKSLNNENFFIGNVS
jgi:hypothetical protein